MNQLGTMVSPSEQKRGQWLGQGKLVVRRVFIEG